MKKVRLAIAVGALPALGMAVAPAAAHAATTAATHTGYRAAGAIPAACGSGGEREADSIRGLVGHISWSGCSHISYQSAHIAWQQAGLTERVRYRNKAGTLLYQTFLGGHYAAGGTQWDNRPNRNAYMVCETLVANSNHTVVKYGAVCETI